MEYISFEMNINIRYYNTSIPTVIGLQTYGTALKLFVFLKLFQ